jgi:hypothetical protein
MKINCLILLFLPFPIRPFGLFPSELIWNWILYKVGRTPWTSDKSCGKAATYTGQREHIRDRDRHPCIEWDSNPQSKCLGLIPHGHCDQRINAVYFENQTKRICCITCGENVEIFNVKGGKAYSTLKVEMQNNWLTIYLIVCEFSGRYREDGLQKANWRFYRLGRKTDPC